MSKDTRLVAAQSHDAYNTTPTLINSAAVERIRANLMDGLALTPGSTLVITDADNPTATTVAALTALAAGATVSFDPADAATPINTPGSTSSCSMVTAPASTQLGVQPEAR